MSLTAVRWHGNAELTGKQRPARAAWVLRGWRRYLSCAERREHPSPFGHLHMAGGARTGGQQC